MAEIQRCDICVASVTELGLMRQFDGVLATLCYLECLRRGSLMPETVRHLRTPDRDWSRHLLNLEDG